MQVCPQCGEPIEEGFQFCVNCGIGLKDAERVVRHAAERASSSGSDPQAAVWPTQPTPEPTPEPTPQPEPQTAVWPTQPQPTPQPEPEPVTEVGATTVSPSFDNNNVGSSSSAEAKPKSKAGLIPLVCLAVSVGVVVGMFLLSPLMRPTGTQQEQGQSVTQNTTAPPAENAAPTSSETKANTESSAPVASSSDSKSQNTQNTQNTQNAQNAQNAQNTQNTKNTQSTTESKPAAPPSFSSTSASSELPGDEVTAYYGSDNAVDNNFVTAWNEGADGDGIGEWVSINASSPQRVSGVSIVNGYPKTGDIFTKNNRCRNVTIILSDGYEQHVTLADAYREYQTFNFDRAHDTTFVRVRIDSVYKGSAWDDTSICELQAF